jgi:carboxypeptidase Taq
MPGDEVVGILERLAERIGPAVRAASAVDDSILDRPLDAASTDAIERRLVIALGFDADRGRIDRTQRAFCTKVGEGDVRITSRLGSVPGLRNLRSSLHEAGHAIYEQALHRLELPSTLAHAPGLGLDESQSRLFERLVGGSPELWEQHFPALVELAPDTFALDEFDAFVTALRAPAVGLVRIDSGDGAYDLHVLLRTRLERELLSGRLAPADLGDAWNAQVQELLGLEVPSIELGCLQDIHWASGMWGYFPTYSLGNIWAAQLHAAALRHVPDLTTQIAQTGSALALRDWLDEHVYRHGRSRSGAEIVALATGARIDETPHADRVDACVNLLL